MFYYRSFMKDKKTIFKNTSHIFLFFILFSLFFPKIAKAESEMFNFGHLVGEYVGAGYMLDALKNSDCAYTYKLNQEAGPARFKEVLNALKPEMRITVEKELIPHLDRMKIDAKQFVLENISLTKKSYDSKTACGMVAGIIGAAAQNADKKWKEYLHTGSKFLK